MPLFLLHEIFPSGPWGVVFAAIILLPFVLGMSTLLFAALGLRVVARGLRRVASVKDGPPPSIRVCLIVLTTCVVAGVLSLGSYGGAYMLGLAVLSPTLLFTSFEPPTGPALMTLVAVSAGYWLLVVTGVRTAILRVRRRGLARVQAQEENA